MARTNIVIDNKLIKEALKVTGAKTKREAVDIALRRLVKNHSLAESVKQTAGKLQWEGNLKAWRKSRL